MAKQPRSHGLDKRLEALGYRLVRRAPDPYSRSTWAILPTRRKCWLAVPNLNSVQSIIEQMEESLRLEFCQWLDTHYQVRPKPAPAGELGLAHHFLGVVKGMESEHVATIIQRWYEPVKE